MQDRAAACRAWVPYVRSIADAFGLRDWTIRISDEAPPEDDTGANMEAVHGRRYAIIQLSDGFLDGMPPEDQRYFVVHELTHVHQAHQDRLAFNEMTDVVHRQYELAAEYGVDGIATAIAPFFPLPTTESKG